MADWVCGASRDLPLATDETWDGAAARESILDWAGYNGDSPDMAKAAKGFLVHDKSQPDNKTAFKLPFALVASGTLKASPAGIRAAASRLPQTDGLSSGVEASARAVISHYEGRMGDHQQNSRAEPRHKMLTGGLKKVAAAQDSDMQAIQALALPGAIVSSEDVLIGSAKVAHDQYDRSNERFPKSYLDRFAETLPGKSLLTGHDYSKAPAGRWFDAEVRPDAETGGSSLYGKFYVDAKSEMARQIQLGIAKDVSIGFVPDTLHCDLCSKSVWGGDCPHFPGQTYDGKLATATYGGDAQKAEAVEGSLVWLGCQPGAQVMGQSSPLYQRKMALAQAALEGDDMELKEALAEIERLKPLAEQAERHKKAAETYEGFLRAEIARKTEIKELATSATHDADAAKKAVAFIQKMSVACTIEQLAEMNTDLDEQLKGVLATKAQSTPMDSSDGTTTKRQPWEPRMRVA